MQLQATEVPHASMVLDAVLWTGVRGPAGQHKGWTLYADVPGFPEIAPDFSWDSAVGGCTPPSLFQEIINLFAQRGGQP